MTRSFFLSPLAIAAALGLAALSPAPAQAGMFDWVPGPVAEAVDNASGFVRDVGDHVRSGAETAGRAIGDGAEQVAGFVARPVEAALAALPSGQMNRAMSSELGRIGATARQITAALPRGAEAARLVEAIGRRDAQAVQALLMAHDPLRPHLDRLVAMGFNTIAVGIESSGAYGIGAGHETGVALDLNGQDRPRLYTSTSAAGGYYFGGGNDLVFTFLRAGNDAINGHAVGSVAEFDVGAGAGLNMWFAPAPFDFAGFSLAVGLGSVGGGGALSYAYTNLLP